MKKLNLTSLFLLACLMGLCQNPSLLKDVYPGSTGSGIQQIVKTSNYTFFNADDDDADADRGLFRTDGTAAGTIKLNLTYPAYLSTKADKLTALGDKVIFAGDNFTNYGEIWASDGTQAGTVALERFQPTITNKVPVVEIAAMGSYAYYSVIDGSNHALLKKTDGTAAGTALVFDFNTVFASAPQVVLFKELNSVLYFIVYDAGGTGYDHLWRTDGTTAGTYELMNFGATQYVASNLMLAGNNLYIMLVTPGIGNVLWKTDGTVAGTVAVKTIGTTGNNNYPQNAAMGSTMYFSGLDGNGMELWKTDGTAAGTVMVADINAGSTGSFPNTLTVLNNNLYFNATTAAAGSELWKFDGVNASLVKDANPGTTGSSPGSFVVSNNTILFRATTATGGAELWITDGSMANTQQVADIYPGITGSVPNLLTAGNPVYFSANNGVNGVEIFKYDNNAGIAGLHKIYVNDNSTTADIFTTAIGNNTNAGSKTAPVASINYAISIAQVGDTILVDAGTFTEQVTTDKAISIIGAGADLTSILKPAVTVAPPGTFTEQGVIQTAQNIGDVHIKDLSVTGDYTVSVTPIIIQSGGSVKNCKLQNGNQGIFFRIESATKTAVIDNNIINVEAIGVNVAGAALTASLTNNSIRVNNPGFSAGIFAGADFGGLPQFTASGNIVSGYSFAGFFTNSLNANITQNSITGVNGPAIQQSGGNAINGTCNWFGTADAELIKSKISGNVTYGPWLTNGTDNNIATGFQPVGNACNGRQNKFYVNDNNQTGDVFTTAVGNNANNGFSSAPFATVDYAYGIAQAGDTILVDAGTYDLAGATFSLSKSVTFYGTNYQVSPNDATNKLLVNTARNAESIFINGIFTIASNDLSLKGFTFDMGDHRSIELQNSAGTNNDFGNFVFAKNILKINTTTSINQFPITGKLVSSPSMPITSGYTLTDNRFQKNGSALGNTFNFNYVKNISITGNSFVVTGSTVKTQQAANLGGAGIVDSITISDNSIEGGAMFVNSNRVATAIITRNKIVNTDRALNVASTMPESSSIEFSNNIMETTTGGGGFIGYNRSGTSLLGTSNVFKVENNTITGVGVTGLTGQLFGSMNFTVNNSVLNPSFIIRGNKITYSGDFSSVTNDFVRPITVRGNVANLILEKNEIALNDAVTILPKPGNSILPANPGITINTDFGSGAYMPSNAVINVLNNKVQGFKQSVVFYDASNGINPYIGYGNVPSGASVNISNNSFTGDSISINNGAVGQIVTANCNWYGATSAMDVKNKVSSTVNYTPWLTNGSDSDIPTTGFQPVDGSCNGTPVSVSFIQENVKCFGANNGSINVTVSNGVAPFAFSWSKDNIAGFSSSEDLADLTPGSYHLQITDANGSVDTTTTVTITEPNVLVATASGNNISCNGANNGTAMISVTGGTAPYTYLWNNNATTDSINALLPGIYSATVTDANGCTAAAEVTITEPEALFISNDGLDVSCNGKNDGFISLSVSGGTGNYTFLWSNGETGSSIYNLGVGTYSVTVTDANGCSIPGSYTILEPAMLEAVATGTNITSAGASDGTISLSITGGTAPYDVLWDNGATDTALTGLAAGIYKANIIDANGCSTSASFEVKGPSLIITVTGTNVSCFAGNNGTATATVNIGTAPFTYVWSNGGTTQTISSLTTGTYSVTVTDASNSSATGEFTISGPSQPVIAALSTNPVSCFGGNNGSASVTASGGTGGYTYLWNNGNTSNALNNLAAGIYSVTVTDANGCAATGNIEVVQPTQLVASVLGTNVSCNGANDGSATASGNGGTSPYTYLWSNAVATQNNPGLAPGTYSVTVTDANGCTSTASYTVVQPAPLSATVSSANVTCFGANNGSITISGKGGTAPYQYSFNNAAYGNTNSWTNLVPGTYSVSVKDANNCLFNSTVTITQPQALLTVVDAVTNTCQGSNNGAISITVSGGTIKYAFSWTGPNGFTSVKEDLTLLAAGTYTIQITDANGCSVIKTATVAEIQPVSVTETITPVSCFGTSTGSIALAVGSGTFTYSWAGPGGYKATTKDIANLKAGSYTVTITPSGNGCVKTATFTVSQPASALAVTTAKTDISSCGGTGSINVTATGGTAPYQYSKGGGVYQSSNSFTGLIAASYTITVKDNKNCTVTATVTIVDDGSDAYEANEKQTTAKVIAVNAPVINARIAPTANDKDWYQFTSGPAGTYTLTVTHPSVLYSYDIYDSRGRVITPATSSSTAKNYTLLANTVYSVQVRGALSYVCYQMQVTSLLMPASTPVFTSINNSLRTEAKIEVLQLNTSAYPNPHNGAFSIKIESPVDGKASVELFNTRGQKLGAKTVFLNKGTNNIVPFTGVRHETIFYRVYIGKYISNGKVIGIN